jgi:hypothetical protein
MRPDLGLLEARNEPGAACLEGLHFHLAIPPRRREGSTGRRIVAANTLREALEFGKTTVFDLNQPCIQVSVSTLTGVVGSQSEVKRHGNILASVGRFSRFTSARAVTPHHVKMEIVSSGVVGQCALFIPPSYERKKCLRRVPQARSSLRKAPRRVYLSDGDMPMRSCRRDSDSQGISDVSGRCHHVKQPQKRLLDTHLLCLPLSITHGTPGWTGAKMPTRGHIPDPSVQVSRWRSQRWVSWSRT